jgi:Trk-type K+ transport system membrane component
VEDKAIGIVAAVVLAMIALRRVRGVLQPGYRREATRQAIGTRSRRMLTAVLTLARVAVALAALAGIVWLASRLFP